VIEVTWVASLPERLAAALPSVLGPWRPAVADSLVLMSMAGLLLTATGVLLRRSDRAT
jgi:hypothetical protein